MLDNPKRGFMKHFWFGFALALFLTAPAYQADRGKDTSPIDTEATEVAAIELSRRSLLLTADGESYQLSATALDEDGAVSL